MFGYVIVDSSALSPEAQTRYRTAYCGLCHRIGARYGLAGRLTLSYDLTFLDLLLCSLYEGESECVRACSRCVMHPFRPVCHRAAAPTDYCADLSIALHYYSARDKWQDDHSPAGLAFMGLLRKKRAEAERRCPRQCEAMQRSLAQLAQYERDGCTDLDAVSGCFGALMAELFDYRQDIWSAELRTLGLHLGKFIYLLDAYDDLARDEKRGSYNPLRALHETPDYEETMREIFELLMAECSRAFERLPCVEDADLLRNILYSGVWTRYNCRQKKHDETK